MDILVRPAKLEDLEAICEVYKKDGEAHTRPLGDYPLVDWIVAKKGVFMVAQTAHKPLGFILVRRVGDEAKIDFFSVMKLFQGKGLESALLEAAETAVGDGTLSVYIPKDDTKRQAFFKKHHYKTQNEVRGMFGADRHGLKLVKDLSTVQVYVLPAASPKAGQQPKAHILKKSAKYKRGDYLKQNIEKLEEAAEEA